MAIGMTYEQYWYGDPMMVGVFRKADKIRQEDIDYQAWLHGQYVAMALQSTIGNVFLAKGQSPNKYPSVPLLMEEKAEKRKERDSKNDEAFAKAYMLQMMQAGQSWGKR